MSAPDEPSDRDAYTDMLVTQALDDLDEGRLDIQSALRTIARTAWDAGRRFERADSGARSE